MHKNNALNKQTSAEILRDFYHRPGHYWQEQKEKICLELFHKVAKQVPAYRQFLKRNFIDSSKIKSYSDFEALPYINKKNYFYQYPLLQTTWPGAYTKQGLVMTATSGSTGKPTYFPRDQHLDWQYSVWAEMFLKNGPRGSTLLVDCFGMGVWIGGLITYQAFQMCALRGYPVTVITPGINKKEIFHALKVLAPKFDNVILAGYPPFIKDLIDESTEEKINKNLKIRLLFAAEGFNEQFRDYLAKKINIKDIFNNTLNIYGSAELGAMAVETPLSILIRRIALQNPGLKEKFFANQKLPTLAQFNPHFCSFETQNGQILITAQNSCPLIRYKIGDNGQVYSFDMISRLFESSGINLDKEAKKINVKLCRLPFVAIYERSDFSTKLYGAIIYAEHIKEALQNKKLNGFLTGRFTMSTKTKKTLAQYLEINLEMKKNMNADKKIAKFATAAITEILLKKNAEYRNNYQLMARKVTPQIKLFTHGHSAYFSNSGKQKWVI